MEGTGSFGSECASLKTLWGMGPVSRRPWLVSSSIRLGMNLALVSTRAQGWRRTAPPGCGGRVPGLPVCQRGISFITISVTW